MSAEAKRKQLAKPVASNMQHVKEVITRSINAATRFPLRIRARGGTDASDSYDIFACDSAHIHAWLLNRGWKGELVDAGDANSEVFIIDYFHG
jgi:hypothetical protein